MDAGNRASLDSRDPEKPAWKTPKLRRRFSGKTRVATKKERGDG
jgi:hypothetical protein